MDFSGKEFLDEMEKYGIKLNYMMYESTQGKIPQIFKMLLIKDMVEKYEAELVKDKGRGAWTDALKIMELYRKTSGSTVGVNKFDKKEDIPDDPEELWGKK